MKNIPFSIFETRCKFSSSSFSFPPSNIKFQFFVTLPLKTLCHFFIVMLATTIISKFWKGTSPYNPVKDWNHVFIIDNPAMYIVMIMILSKYKISKNRVLVTYLRKGTVLTNSIIPIVDYNEFWFDKYITKVLRVGLKGRRILKKITKKNFQWSVWNDQNSWQANLWTNSKETN